LRKEYTNVILSIKDDGVGFDREPADVANTLGGNGLRNMRIRANELNGELEIVTTPGIGTEIQLKWKAKFHPSL
jgi:signal transduction histidine kinase